jgi:hypothetical protein
MNETLYWWCDDCSESGVTDAKLVQCPECGSRSELHQSDEPHGAGADPFGRPDPQTHPEFWTE